MERWCNEADIKWAVERELKKGTQVRNEEMCRERSAAAFGPAAGAGSGQRPGSAEPVPRPRGPPTRCGGLSGLPWRFRPRRGRRAATKRGPPPTPSQRPADGERGPGPAEAPRASPAPHPARGEGAGGIPTSDASLPALRQKTVFDENKSKPFPLPQRQASFVLGAGSAGEQPREGIGPTAPVRVEKASSRALLLPCYVGGLKDLVVLYRRRLKIHIQRPTSMPIPSRQKSSACGDLSPTQCQGDTAT